LQILSNFIHIFRVVVSLYVKKASLVPCKKKLSNSIYSSKLSNRNFSEKKSFYAKSNFTLNTYFQEVENWTGEAIRKRSEILAERILSIWPDLGSNKKVSHQIVNSVTGKTPKSVYIKGERVLVKTWKSIAKHVLNALLEESEELAEQIANSQPKFFTREKSTLRAPETIGEGFFMESNCSAQSFYKKCSEVAYEAGWTELNEGWRVELEE
jgi:Protein of unknown function (DUF1524)